MIDWDTIETTAELSKQFKSLALTPKERQALDDAPDDIVSLVTELMAQYTPLQSPYNIRDAVVLKSLALLILDLPNIERQLIRGYES
jgi:hypothetical protein